MRMLLTLLWSGCVGAEGSRVTCETDERTRIPFDEEIEGMTPSNVALLLAGEHAATVEMESGRLVEQSWFIDVTNRAWREEVATWADCPGGARIVIRATLEVDSEDFFGPSQRAEIIATPSQSSMSIQTTWTVPEPSPAFLDEVSGVWADGRITVVVRPDGGFISSVNGGPVVVASPRGAWGDVTWP